MWAPFPHNVEVTPPSPRRRAPRLGVHVTDAGRGRRRLRRARHGVSTCACSTATTRSAGSASTARCTGCSARPCPDVRAGQRYGFRAHGPWEPARGPPLQPRQAAGRPVRPRARRRASRYGAGDVRPRRRTRDLVGRPVRPGGPARLGRLRPALRRRRHPRPAAARTRRPTARGRRGRDTVVYEAHVRGLTLLRRPDARGAARHLRRPGAPAVSTTCSGLGVTAIELLPVHAFASEPHLVEKGLTNYWGYSTLGFFAPHAAFATAAAQAAGPGGRARRAARARSTRCTRRASRCCSTSSTTTRARAALPGQHLSWRGLDNAAYYAHDGGAPAALADVTGTGQHARLPPGRGGPDDPRLAALLGGRRRASTASGSTSR